MLGIGAGAGAIIGSFLGALVMRWPQGRSVVTGRSACDSCGAPLGPLEMIPLLSALALRGRCRRCGGSIAALHFAMELGCAAIGAGAFLLAPFPAAAGWAVLGWILLTLAVLDWRHFWMPDRLTLPLAFLGFTLGLWTTDLALWDRVIGAAAGYGALLAAALAYRAWRGQEGLGLGDAKLLGAIGAWMGWQALPFVLLIASLSALLVTAITAVRQGRLDRARPIPLGTYLCVATLPGWMMLSLLIG
ncbi:prepilin peptidase [Sphingobium algorifonticola]|nr:A24 family peptidase [Sphingobium algorifonticola]